MRFILACSLLVAISLVAPAAKALEFYRYPEAVRFIQEMEDKHGFYAYDLEQLFEEVEIREDIVRIMDTPGEAKPWHAYRDQFVTALNARRGVNFWKKWQRELESAQHQYGVDIEIILGIIGVETQFGVNLGQYRVIDALATLAFAYPRRSALFRRELEQFLVLTRDLKHNPLTVTGSYAGAIGLPQFLPSSYRQYAVDFDRDNKVNLMGSETDAIGSIANYLKVHGWKRGQPITDRAVLENGEPDWYDSNAIKPEINLAALRKDGVLSESGHTDDGLRAALLRLRGRDSFIYHLGFHNFFVITRYNRSTKYAMAVVELGQMIKHRYNENQ